MHLDLSACNEMHCWDVLLGENSPFATHLQANTCNHCDSSVWSDALASILTKNIVDSEVLNGVSQTPFGATPFVAAI